MDYNVNGLIISRLKDQYQMKTRGIHLREGACPDCDKKSLWTWTEKPGMVQCNRVSKCGYSESTRSLFPDLFEDLDKKYPKTETNPNATADAYLAMVRGFDLDQLRGSYSQQQYYHPNGDRGTTSIRFYLSMEKGIYWERLLDTVTITDPKDGSTETRNMSFKGSFKGLWWMPPLQKIEANDTVYLTEGIFDCIALWLAGHKACAIMSAGSLPKETLKSHFNQKINWRLALDNDKAGRKYTHKHVAWLKEQGEHAGAIFSSESLSKLDWNDLHQRDQLTDEDFRNYKYYGKMELVKKPINKAQLMFDHSHKQKRFFCFSLFNRTYSCKVDKEKYDLSEAELNYNNKNSWEIAEGAFFNGATLKEIASFVMEFLYFQQPESGEDGQYFFRFNFSNHAPEMQIAYTGKTFGGAGDFKKAAMHKAPGALFSGSTKELDMLYTDWLTKTPKIVKTLDYAGFDKTTQAYVYNHFAVQGKKIIKENAESFFQLKKGAIKTTTDLKQKLTDQRPKDWFHDYKTAFGEGGLVALCWWVGCLYVEQIRQDYRSYPFFEIVGEAGSGKSDMVDFLWKLYGKEGESFNPNSSTLAGRVRKMSEVANLPVVFNEVDNESAQERRTKQFNWDEQKDLYDGEFGRVTGVKTQDNNTKKPQFKAGLCVVQNIPIIASEAILSRIVHLQFDRSHHSHAGKVASDKLNRLGVLDVSGFLLHSNAKADAFLKHFEQRLAVHIAKLQQNENITLQRIIENHAKMMAVADCLSLLMPMVQADVDAIHKRLITMAETRQLVLRQDTPRVILFWENFNYLNTRFDNPDGTGDIRGEDTINHHPVPEDYIAVNLVEYFRLVSDKKMDTIETTELHKILPSSIEYEFVGNQSLASRLTGRRTRVWVFKTQDKKRRDLEEQSRRKGNG